MRARIVKIGNSQGIRLPKPVLEQTGLTDDVELEVGENQIIIRAVSHPREGWESAFKTMSEMGDDAIIDDADSLSHAWDEKDWQW